MILCIKYFDIIFLENVRIFTKQLFPKVAQNPKKDKGFWLNLF